MLQIKDIRKEYRTGDLVQTALDGVSLNLRDNEFVAILGPSGSGKTTLLNVIGGLDRYDSGDLIINGISTKEYTDRDWDSYRNHTIGFIFQSYNLIPHQTVLANVELALTISGISPGERRRRAKKALEDVGLGNQIHKKPNQMSGGQMQRVAIARALVNNPDILLADEPTGALDSDTSVQVMELLKEVSRDRLVVMVTHNPELAEEYASRIVRVRDGRIIDDTDPFEPDAGELTPPEHKNMGRSSMSVFTALSLSFNNLWTKKARTLLTSFAGSIGIIGIALIMSLSTGFQEYIDKIQEDTLSTYPLIIQSETADMTSAMVSFGAAMEQMENVPPETVREQQMISQMFAQIGTNDLGAFKTHLENNMDEIGDTLNGVKYGYSITPRVFAADTSEKVLQVNPATLFGDLTGNAMMSAYMDSNVFHEMIGNRALLDSQYDVLRGRWPEAGDELVMVLSDPASITDYTAYTLGMRDAEELTEMVQQVMEGNEVENISEPMEWSYDDLMSMTFRMVAPSDMYRYNEEFGVWEDMSSDEEYMRSLVKKGTELRVVGIVCPKEGVSASALSSGLAYTSALTDVIIDAAEQAPIVQAQLSDSDVDVFTGKPFDQLGVSGSDLDFQDMISVDTEMLSSAFGINIGKDFLEKKMKEYMDDLGDSIADSSAPAQADFMNTLRTMGVNMLKGYIAANADPATGKAPLSVTDAQSIVENYMAGSDAALQIAALQAKHTLPDGTLAQVYRPLLIGLVTSCAADAMPDVELPDAELPEELPDIEDILPEMPEELPDIEDVLPELPEELPDIDDVLPEMPEELPDIEDVLPELPEELPDISDVLPEIPDVTGGTETNEPKEEPERIEMPSGSSPGSGSGEGTPSIPDMEVPDVSLPIDPDMIVIHISADQVDGLVESYLSSAVVTGASGAMALTMTEASIREELADRMAGISKELMRMLASSFSVDADKIAGAFDFALDEEELTRLMTAFSGGNTERTANSNLHSLGYADRGKPTSISIYMVDFAAKERFLAFLDGYNEDMEAQGNEDQVIKYTDMTGVLMSSVKTIVDSVSYVLIAFVAVSLIVSSIMIGIITYISVLERTKEIGVLRAIGASKRNISQVFNAETFIIGLCAGLIGVGVTLLVVPVINAIIHSLIGSADINAQLPVLSAVVLVLLSMLLTIIGGLIPSKKAANKDPVIALRSE